MNTALRFQAGEILRMLATLFLAAVFPGCNEPSYEGKPAKDYGVFRLKNEAHVAVTLYLDDALKLTALPGEEKSLRAPDGPVRASVRTEKGRVLFEQVAEIPNNAYAQYNVKADLKVVTSAGNVALPYQVGSDTRQVRLNNGATYPVEILVDNAVAGAVAPKQLASFDLPAGTFTIRFRRQGGQVLFTQTLDIPRNGFIAYNVLSDGSVIATGGEVKPNDQIKEPPYITGGI